MSYFVACSKCCVEMRCSRNSILLLWGRDHCRAGDEYACLSCGAKTVVANSNSYMASPLEIQYAEESGRLRRMD